MKECCFTLAYVAASVVPVSRVEARLCNVDGGAAMGTAWRGMAQEVQKEDADPTEKKQKCAVSAQIMEVDAQLVLPFLV